MNSNTFENFRLDAAILRALGEEGYRQPTDIQQATLPHVLDGRDVVATAQTGTGKTAAFCLPILERLRTTQGSRLRALVLTPTRELALQIEGSFRAYGRHLSLKTAVVLGGVPINRQVQAVRRRPDILVATPGRLLDLIRQKHVRLDAIEVLVLDEADRMLDMGFIRDVRAIIRQVPTKRQTLLFSATLPPEIASLASEILIDPVSVATTPPASVVVKIDQRVLFVDQAQKTALLVDVLRSRGVRKALVFTRTKHRADRVVRQLSQNDISAVAIHSNKSQNQRQRSLAAFEQGRVRVLVATDIVARGIDVEEISHVINYELPNDAESYVHRVGRTARAGASGTALSFCDTAEIPVLRGIERLIRHRLSEVKDHPFPATAARSGREPRAYSPAGPARKRSAGPGARFAGRRRLAS